MDQRNAMINMIRTIDEILASKYAKAMQAKEEENSSTQDFDDTAMEAEHDDLSTDEEGVEYDFEVKIGQNRTLIPLSEYETINFNTTIDATRGLLNILFDSCSLAKHAERPLKRKQVHDVMECVIENVPGCLLCDVQSAINAICSEEAEKYCLRKLAKKKLNSKDVEQPSGSRNMSNT